MCKSILNYDTPSQQHHLVNTRLTRHRRQHPTINALLTLVPKNMTSQCYIHANGRSGATAASSDRDQEDGVVTDRPPTSCYG